jgi:hypothetical protein
MPGQTRYNRGDHCQRPHAGQQGVGSSASQIARKTKGQRAHAAGGEINHVKARLRLRKQFAPRLHQHKFHLVASAGKLLRKDETNPFDAAAAQVGEQDGNLGHAWLSHVTARKRVGVIKSLDGEATRLQPFYHIRCGVIFEDEQINFV